MALCLCVTSMALDYLLVNFHTKARSHQGPAQVSHLLIGDMLLPRPDKAAFLSRSMLALILLSEILLMVEPRPTTNAQINAAMSIKGHTTSPCGAKKPTTISVQPSKVIAMMTVARLIALRICRSSLRCSCEGDGCWSMIVNGWLSA